MDNIITNNFLQKSWDNNSNQDSINILNGIVNSQCVRIYENNIQIRLMTQRMWFPISISSTQLFECVKSKKPICHKTKESQLFFYKAKNGTTKIHIFSPVKIIEGGISFIHGGYKLSGKNLPFLKPTILKVPKISEHRLDIVQSKLQKQYQESDCNKTDSEVKKEAKKTLYAFLSNCFIKEKESFDLLYGPNQKTLTGIQKKIDCFQIKNKTYLVSARYSHTLFDTDLSLNQKLQGAKQLAWGLKEIFKKKCRTIDIKTENVVFNEDKDKIEMVHIDLELYNQESINESIKNGLIDRPFPLNSYTPDYLHKNDLIKLYSAVDEYKNTKKEECLEYYMKTSKKIMIYQLGNIYLFLFTGAQLAQEDKDMGFNPLVNKPSLILSGSEMKKRITETFEEQIKQEPRASTALERIYSLLIKMLDENSLNRPKINEVIQTLHTIDVLQQLPQTKNDHVYSKISHSI